MVSSAAQAVQMQKPVVAVVVCTPVCCHKCSADIDWYQQSSHTVAWRHCAMALVLLP